jgi:putative phosphoesterase
MRVAAIYDIHGNLPALEAVLGEVRQSSIDQIIVGGDVVPGPMPSETLRLLRHSEIPIQFIQGNGDREVLARMRGVETESVPEQFRGLIRWVAEELQPEDEELLASWPLTCRVRVESLGEVLFCHATPRNDNEIFTRLTSEERLLPVFADLDVPLVICGHTHMQFDRMVGRVRVVNAGSVGMPFGNPGADWLLLGPDVELRRTSYDLATAADRIRATTYPQAQEFAQRNVLQPPTEESMLQTFSRYELT